MPRGINDHALLLTLLNFNLRPVHARGVPVGLRVRHEEIVPHGKDLDRRQPLDLHEHGDQAGPPVSEPTSSALVLTD
jgi:hypothetical protein